MKPVKVIIPIVGAVIALLFLAWAMGLLDSRKPLPSSSEPGRSAPELAQALLTKPSLQDVAAGGPLYAANCAACHGANLEGQANWQEPNENGTPKAPPHDDSGHTWHHDDLMLFRYTKLGGKAVMAQAGVSNFLSGMPGFSEDLSDKQIRQILAFIKSRWSSRSRKVQRERSRTALSK